jgi:hypothetical protein
VNGFSPKSIFPLIALGLILVVQAGLTFLDATPRYLMGDSGSYLWSMYNGGPWDRSWTYPAWFLRPLIGFHSVQLVVYVQIALGLIPAWLAFRLVSGPCGRGCGFVGVATAILCLIEPLALTYQRFILTDSLGLVMSAAALFLCVRVIDRSAGATAYAALAPPFMVLAASLRTAQVPSLAMLSLFLLILLFLVYRDYRSGAALLASLIVCQAVFSHYAIKNQGVPGYNAASGRFMLAAVLPIVSRDDVQPYIDPERVRAILDDQAKNRRERPGELFQPGQAADQILQASGSPREGNRLSGRIAEHAILRDPIGFLALAWSTWLDYFDEPDIVGRVLEEAGDREFDPGLSPYFAELRIYDAVDTHSVQSPVRRYFEAAWKYYGWIPAISAMLLAASLAADRRLSTLTLAAFALASAASHIAFSTESVPRYFTVSAWANVVVAGRIACVLATRLSAHPPRPPSVLSAQVNLERHHWLA